MSSLGSRLSVITRELMLQWGETKEYWHDAQSRDFELRYLSTLPSSADAAAEVMEQIEKLLAKVKHDCE